MRILHEALKPPDGFELEHLLVTTFTLDLVSLLSIPLAFTWFGGHGDADAIERDPLELLAAVQRQAGRITVFHQAGAIARPDRHRMLLPLVEDSLVAVPAPRNGGVFHPKLWLATYGDDHGTRAHRLLCLSRNLTADRCWDTILSLDGEPTRSQRPESKPLADFVAWLARASRLAPERAKQVRQLGRQLSAVRFHPPAPFKGGVQFRPLGIRGYREDPIARARRDRLLVVSPFIGAEQLNTLYRGAERNILVTRPEELGRLNTVPPTVTSVLRLDDALEAEPDEADEVRAWLAGLHAKVYVADQGWDATVWTGSANATGAAFHQNVEFLVELTGKRSACGVETILGDGSAGTFSSMLVPCDGEVAEKPDDELELSLDRLAREVAELPLEIRVAEEDAGWALELASQDALSVQHEARVDVSPLMWRGVAQNISLEGPKGVLARFEGMKAHEVSGLCVVELRLEGVAEVARSFVACWPLVGVVPDRVRALLVELATDRDRVMAFIRMFLAGGEMPPPSTNWAVGEGGGVPWGPAASPESPLLELFVRALAREPERLDELARWLPDIAAAASDGAGAELLQIWEPIWQARQELAG
jgi:hypothetical protein